MKTTAQLRSEARVAEERQDHEAAAALYDQAADRYPGDVTGALAQADIKNLRLRAVQLRAHVAAGCVA